jgi:hypothetical protein
MIISAIAEGLAKGVPALSKSRLFGRYLASGIKERKHA